MPVLRPGQTFKEVALKNERKAILRAPAWQDLNDLLNFINELVEERAEILRTTKSSLKEEAEWLGERLASIEVGNLIALVAEVDGRIVASSEVGQWTPEYPASNHVGVLGIAILKNSREIGLGTALMESIIQLSKQAGFKVVILDTFATNTLAHHLYRKVGFAEVGRIPKAIHRDENYIDLIRFAIEI